MKIYAFPKVGRSGLGNCLFPWARAEVFAWRHTGRVLAPRWNALRLGPYLRGESEKRFYGGFFKASHHVTGFARRKILAIGQHVSENQLMDAGDIIHDSWRPLVVEFSGTNTLFATITPHHAFIRQRLWDMTATALRPKSTIYGARFIALHVRRGDITRQGFTDNQLLRDVCQYTPSSWFISMIKRLSQFPQLKNLPVILFTDGYPDEVLDIASVEGVHIHENQSAITDLLTLSNASLLFASGYSTFSMWASFLGGMPTIYASGKMQQEIQTGRCNACELELAEEAEIPEDVVSIIIKRFSDGDSSPAYPPNHSI